MKKVSIILIIISTALSLSAQKNNDANRHIFLNDTVTTSSGLKYIFLKEGKGRKIEVGSLVKAYTDLYVNDADTVHWSTSTEKDSIFEFIHGKTPLIKGFTELNNYLAEGDEVIAILPDSLAYGKNGSSDGIPPGARLIYNPYIVKYVSEPKELLSDTLYTITKTTDAKTAAKFYEEVINNELKNDYYTDLNTMFQLLEKLNKDSLYTEVQYLADYFVDKTNDNDLQDGFKYYKILTLYEQGKYKEAFALVEPLTRQERNQKFWKTILNEIQKKLPNK